MKMQTVPGQNLSTYRVSSTVPHSALVLGGLGAVVGAGNAVARTKRQVKEEEISRQQAVEKVINESVGTGLAVAAATAVVGATRARGVTSLVGVLAVTAGAKYLWDTATAPSTGPRTAQEDAPASKTTKKTASTAKAKTSAAAKTKS